MKHSFNSTKAVLRTKDYSSMDPTCYFQKSKERARVSFANNILKLYSKLVFRAIIEIPVDIYG